MKKFFSLSVLLFTISFFFVSCRDADTQRAEPEMTDNATDPQSVSPTNETKLVEPERVIQVTPEKFYVGEYTKSEAKEEEGDQTIHYNQELTFGLSFQLPGDIKKDVVLTFHDYWTAREKELSQAYEMQALREELKNMKPRDFSVTMTTGVDNPTIKKVVLPSKYEESKDGKAGKLLSPEREFYPSLYLNKKEGD